ncbi:hypothetical protein VAE122_2130001 [Vibrio aestuarianus]|nr:hypothetical protein VAE122_2130001 [Vibrio aestuarianus]CAH8242467.1 hypothetical protein VAEKB19_6800001 [Vibrio aestuarianus]
MISVQNNENDSNQNKSKPPQHYSQNYKFLSNELNSSHWLSNEFNCN